MDNFQKQLQLELLRQQRLLEEQNQILAASPEGFLFARNRKQQKTFYHQRKIKEGRSWKTIQDNINDNPLLQNTLIEKKLAEKSRRIYNHNIPLLQALQSDYQSANPFDIQQQLPPTYDELLKIKQQQEIQQWLDAPYRKCPYYPQHLSHRTAYGEYVRSKGEVIVANALYSFGIPFHYEEALFFANPDDYPFYPDFTIRLPNSNFLYWEHWGLLSKESYCKDNAEKLYLYQENNLILGKNLIITQDDKHGNCHSYIVYDTIKHMVLPHFQGMDFDFENIKK